MDEAGAVEQRIAAAVAARVSARHNAGAAVTAAQSLFYSGMVDSLGIQELAAWLRELAVEHGAGFSTAKLRVPTAADIVENDLDTAELIARFMCGGGAP